MADGKRTTKLEEYQGRKGRDRRASSEGARREFLWYCL